MVLKLTAAHPHPYPGGGGGPLPGRICSVFAIIHITLVVLVGRHKNEWVGGNLIFTSSGDQRWAGREMGNTNKNTATLMFRTIFE